MKACGPPDARGVGRAFAIVVCVSSRKPRRGWRTHLLRNRFRRFGGMVNETAVRGALNATIGEARRGHAKCQICVRTALASFRPGEAILGKTMPRCQVLLETC